MHLARRKDSPSADPPYWMVTCELLQRWHHLKALDKAKHRSAFATWQDKSIDLSKVVRTSYT